jgi:dephospho-CoA kinase
MLEPGTEGYKKVVDVFGPSILNKDQSIDRSRLGGIVFSDEGYRNRLNSILHPLIRAKWHSLLQQHRLASPGIPAVVDIPLLFETGAQAVFDRTVCIGCCAQTQHERLTARGWDSMEIERRRRAQWPLEEKIKHSDLVIWNDGSLELLQHQLERLAA